MNNDEALAILQTKRNAVNSAINNLQKYVQDIAAWDGTPAPMPEEIEEVE